MEVSTIYADVFHHQNMKHLLIKWSRINNADQYLISLYSLHSV